MRKTVGRRTYKRPRGQKAVLGEQEKRRLMQLAGCILLFLAVFLAKGTGKLNGFRQELAQLLQMNVDFRQTFANLGWSVASGKPVGKTLNELWVDVFLPGEKQQTVPYQEGPLYHKIQEEREVSLTAKIFPPKPNESKEENTQAQVEKEEDTSADDIRSPEPEAEPAIVHVEYTGPELPENTTMDRYALGLKETMSPVSAALTSGFGWREHPITGGEKFHCGVDLGVETGTDVLAFASGTVDYIGESDAYGLYLQLRHDNGVTSFYAHCSKLCVQQGQTVVMGEKVAESGATGDVTGPHLHFEMKKDGIRINPAYYIEVLS